MIYSVVPKALEGELRERLETHYADEPGVTVIAERRQGERREQASSQRGARELRDRRRRRPGDIPEVVV
ncbi:MAG: hypothetical protein M3P40_01170 [Actinomycetota bacterium]|nr:hypothetical protein [Actinomycetota bacterium]